MNKSSPPIFGPELLVDNCVSDKDKEEETANDQNITVFNNLSLICLGIKVDLDATVSNLDTTVSTPSAVVQLVDYVPLPENTLGCRQKWNSLEKWTGYSLYDHGFYRRFRKTSPTP